MKLYNDLTQKKEDFVPLTEGKVSIYTCGPTVYNYFHIGNARVFIVFDCLRRHFERKGYDVNFVQNFTDVDDKIIARAKEEGLSDQEIADRYIEEYFIDADGLGVKRASVHPRVTETMDEIVGLVQTLIDKRYAYEVKGDVYYRTGAFSDYGKLSRQSIESLKQGARVEVADIKENPLDFALWKAAKDDEPSWDSPWGAGRPGWHIECSAMALKHIGPTVDIHTGGQDLIFPHHENEIAQSEAANGVPFARYWLHNGYMNVDDEKMSKSLGNFFTAREVADVYGYEAIRFFILSAHYRSQISYSTEILEQAKAGLARLYNCKFNLQFLLDRATDKAPSAEEAALISRLDGYTKRYDDAMDDDLNTADALSVIFEMVRDINTLAVAERSPSADFLLAAKNALEDLCSALGLCQQELDSPDAEVETLIAQREAARAAKDYQLADTLRDALSARGIVLEDTAQGVKWRRS